MSLDPHVYKVQRGEIRTHKAFDSCTNTVREDAIYWQALDNSGHMVTDGISGTLAYARTDAYIALIRADCAPF